MKFLIILTYFIIGFVVGLFIYDYHCKDFNKKNKQFKLTWEEYSRREGPGFCMAFAIVLWPFFLLVGICYYMFQYPIECIKKRNGIK
jgi:uncharacterized membrane protein